MSFDLYVCPLPDARWGDAERKKITSILHRDAETTDMSWAVRYPDDSGAREISGLDDWDEDKNEKRGLCFRRFGRRIFTDRLYELADRLDAMVYWPGDPPFIAVTRQELFRRLPADLEVGYAVVVRDADDLMAQICK